MAPGDGPGRLEAIWLKRVKKGPMDRVDEAGLEEGVGLVGNADRGGWRQITLIEREVFDRMREAGLVEVDPAMRRANMMVSGIRLEESRDRVLRVGSCRIRVRGETRPCRRMEEAAPGLQGALGTSWNGGAFGVVVTGGTVRVGDRVEWEDEDASTTTSRAGRIPETVPSDE